MKRKLSLETQVLNSLFIAGEHLNKMEEILPIGDLVQLVRSGLGMTQRQLAKRAGVPHSTIARIEKKTTSPTEEILRKIFAAMECDIAWIPVPRFKSIDHLLRAKAKKIAEKHMRYLEGTMALEKQKPEKKWRERLLESEIETLLETPSRLWDENEEE